MEAACDAGYFVAIFVSELLEMEFRASKSAGHALIPVKPITDCKSLYDAVRKQTTSTTERRVQVDLASIRETVGGGGEQDDPMRWVPTQFQLADGFTKRCAKLRQVLAQFCMKPEICLIERSKSGEPVVAGESANLATSWQSLKVAHRLPDKTQEALQFLV